MSQAQNNASLGASGPGKRLPPLETKGPSERKDKGLTDQTKKSKTDKIKEDLVKIEETVRERHKNKSPEHNAMGNQKRVSKEPNSPKKTKPAKPPKPAGLGKCPADDLSLQASSYSFGKKKIFVTNTQKQREIDKLTHEKENTNKKLQKTRVLSPLADVPKMDKTKIGNDDRKPGSLTINLFLSDDAISSAPEADKKSPSSGGRQLSVQVPLDQLDLLQSLPTGKATILPKIGESETKGIDLNKTYPPPRPGTPPQRCVQDFSKSVGHGHYHGDPDRSLYRNPAESYQGPVWLMGQAPKNPGRPELPPIKAGQAGNFETYVPPSSSYNFSQKDEDERGHGDHCVRELKNSEERKRKKRKKHKHHDQQHSENHDIDDGETVQQPGDEKVMQWLEGHEFDMESSEMDPETEGRMSVNVYDRPSSVIAPRPSNVPGAYGHGGAAMSGADLPDVFTMEQMAALREMQCGMTGVDRFVATPRAWNQDGDDVVSSTTCTKAHSIDPKMHIQDMPQPYDPGPPSDILKKSSQHMALEKHENCNKTHNSTPRTSRTLQTEQTSYSDPIRKCEMGTQAGGPVREETFYVQGTPHRSVACSTDEDKQSTQRAPPSVHSVGIGPEELTQEGNNPQENSRFFTIKSDGASNQNQVFSSQNQDNQSQISATSSPDRNVAIELRSKNVQILKVLREDEELGSSHSANRRTARYSSQQDNQAEPRNHRNSSHETCDSGCPADELDAVLGDDEIYVVFLKTKDGAIIGPFQLDIENVEVGLPTAEDLLGEGSSSETKAKTDNPGWFLHKL